MDLISGKEAPAQNMDFVRGKRTELKDQIKELDSKNNGRDHATPATPKLAVVLATHMRA
jgi:hypothetical protein